MCKKQTQFTIQTNSVDCVTQFEAAGSVVTVKRSPSSKRVKARGDAKGSDIFQFGSVEATTRTQ
jgi:hypothetical protein